MGIERKAGINLNKDEAPIVTMSSLKGGTGKSTISFNFASYLARKGQKVLIIDLDYQRNMSSNFDKKLNNKQMQDCSIINIFKHDAKDPQKPFDFHPAPVGHDLSLISSYRNLDDVDMLMSKRAGVAPYVLMHLIYAEKLQNKYDWIIIDTHNNFKTLTKNAFIVSDAILSPVTESRYSITAVGDMIKRLKELKRSYFNVKLGRSDITAKLYFIGNMIEYNTNLSKQFASLVKSNSSFIAGFHKRSIFQKSTATYHSIYSYVDDNKDYSDKRIIRNEISPEFRKIEKTIKD